MNTNPQWKADERRAHAEANAHFGIVLTLLTLLFALFAGIAIMAIVVG
jgi:hypothetical protein